jgi:hypothetical protein
MLTKKQKRKLQLEHRVRRNPEKALLQDGEYLPQTLFESCVDECPRTAFITEKLCSRLDRIQFELMCKQYYWDLTTYKHVVDRLTDIQFDEYVRIFPGSSIFSRHAVVRMSDAQFDYCIKTSPDLALSYNHSLERLSPEQFHFCVRRSPRAAVQKKACQRLTPVQFDEILKGYIITLSDFYMFIYVQDKLNPYQEAYLKKTIF